MGLVLKCVGFPLGDWELATVLGPGMPDGREIFSGLSALGTPLGLGAAALGLAAPCIAFLYPAVFLAQAQPSPSAQRPGFGSQPRAV